MLQCFLFGRSQNCNDPLPAPFSTQVGLNYLFSDDGTYSKLEGIATKFRQFTLWHNAGNGGGNPAYDENQPNIFLPGFTYNNGNFFDTNLGTQNDINLTINDLKSNGLVSDVFLGIATSHGFLSTGRVFNGGSWGNGGYEGRFSIWRKPIPFTEFLVNPANPAMSPVGAEPAVNPNIMGGSESFTKPQSYRFYAEYLSHLVSMFGSDVQSPLDPEFTHFKYPYWFYKYSSSRI